MSNEQFQHELKLLCHTLKHFNANFGIKYVDSEFVAAPMVAGVYFSKMSKWVTEVLLCAENMEMLPESAIQALCSKLEVTFKDRIWTCLQLKAELLNFAS